MELSSILGFNEKSTLYALRNYWKSNTLSLRDYILHSLKYKESLLYQGTELKKNDPRNSGGMLRQKFNFIDIWNLTFDIQPMDQWTNALLVKRVNGVWKVLKVDKSRHLFFIQ